MHHERRLTLAASLLVACTMKIRLATMALSLAILGLLACRGEAGLVALINSPTGNPTFVNNFQTFVESEGFAFVRNPATFENVDIMVNVRMPVTSEAADWVRGGGFLISEYNTAAQPVFLGGLINATVASRGLVGTGTPVTFTPAGVALGLNSGLANPYSDGGATEFFLRFGAIGPDVSILATRPGTVTGDPPLPAILGASAGSGYVLALGYDWADGFITSSPATRQLLHNSFAAAVVPEPSSFALAATGLGAIFMIRRRPFKSRGTRGNSTRTAHT